MTTLAKYLWNKGTRVQRAELLFTYFKTPETVVKHVDKEWGRLPGGFRTRLIQRMNESHTGPKYTIIDDEHGRAKIINFGRR